MRPLALTMPAVALFSKPNGAPIASTHSPTLSVRESPSFTVGRSLAAILMIAISDFGSTPTTLAVYSRRSVRRTVTSLAPSTTCALVMITPSGLMMNPEPSPRIGCGCGIWNGWPRKNGANGLLGPKGLLSLGLSLPSEFSSPCEFRDADILATTLMLTTAGPYFCTMVLKSGSIVAGLAAGGGVAAAGLAAAAVVASADVATARVAPATYSAPTGTAMVAAPRTAAMSGFLRRLSRFMAILRVGRSRGPWRVTLGEAPYGSLKGAALCNTAALQALGAPRQCAVSQV